MLGYIGQRGASSWEISYYDNEGRRRRETYSTEQKAEKMLQRKLDAAETRISA
jgi:hypothetical protein